MRARCAIKEILASSSSSASHVGGGMQQQLLASSQGEPIEIGPYISRLCETLLASMTGDSRPVSLQFRANGGTASSAETVSIGLIVTELVINAFKHAFVGHRAQAGLSS